jgi:hypothetical protein
MQIKITFTILETIPKKYLIIQSLNAKPLNHHYQNIIVNPNLQASRI